MKKAKLWLLFLLIFCFSVPVLADSTETRQPSVSSSAPKIPLPSPISVNQKNVDGNEYITKTYEVAVGFDPAILVENGFEQNGFLFAHLKTEKKENENRETKAISESVTIETETNNREGILNRLPATKDYEKDGFKGTLTLDTSSISTQVSGYATKTSTISTVKEYPGLMYADPSYIPQTASKDGHTLPLVNVDWVVMGTGLAGDTLVPTEYKATASYSKKVTSKAPSGYVTTANYMGTVSKTNINSVIYTLTYVGTPLFIPAEEPEPAPEPKTEQKGISLGIVLSVLLAITAIGGGGTFLFFFLKSSKGVQVYNLIDKEYINIGKQTIDAKNPLVDLNEFKDVIQSNSFAFVLDKAVTNKLFGKNIAVTLDDVTVKHMVKGFNEQYHFNLEFGGVLDVE